MIALEPLCGFLFRNSDRRGADDYDFTGRVRIASAEYRITAFREGRARWGLKFSPILTRASDAPRDP